MTSRDRGWLIGLLVALAVGVVLTVLGTMAAVRSYGQERAFGELREGRRTVAIATKALAKAQQVCGCEERRTQVFQEARTAFLANDTPRYNDLVAEQNSLARDANHALAAFRALFERLPDS